MKLPVIFNDRYQLIKKIGEGGLAEVYQARDMALGRMVAVKALRSQYIRDPSFLVNFHREAQNSAKLSDSYIVPVYDFGQDMERPYIVMEWIAGSDLRTVINENRIIPINQAVIYTIHICSAVGTAHRAGFVHGDLKPGNILITPTNQAKVTDFGLARALGESAMDEGEVVWGTPAYFAPEQASGDLVLPATDVYAIGIILYEMLTGRVPFVGVDDQDVARKQLYEAHTPVDRLNSSIPEPLARIVDAAMAKNPNERFLTADHLREALIMYKKGNLNNATPISSVVGSPVQSASYSAPSSSPPPPPPPRRFSPSPTPAPAVKSSKWSADVIALIVGLIIIIVIASLIPLFIAIYRAYASSPDFLTENGYPTPLPTLQTGQIRMPDITGVEEARARIALKEMGLNLVVDGEELHPSIPALSIIRQSIPAGAGADRGSAVFVTLSQGPSMIEIPDVTGLIFAEAERNLTALGLTVQKYEEWSVEEPGRVVGQDPPAGSLVASPTLVTLIVSSGSRVIIGANLGRQILFSAYEIPRLQFRVGEVINLTFFWETISVPTGNYNLFINLTTLQGGIVSRIDVPPQGGSRPTGSWRTGDIVVDPYQLTIPATTAPGDYQIRIGFYDPVTKARLPILEPGRGEQDNLGAIILRGVQVIP